MLTIGIIDEGIGGMHAYSKLKQVISANYVVQLVDNSVPLGDLSKGKLIAIAKTYTDNLQKLGCDSVVTSSISLTNAGIKLLQATSSVKVFGCEAPIMHACTYSASNVLVVGDKFVTSFVKLPNCITCALPRFPVLAESCNERDIVTYLTDNLEQFSGQFDCIALANSSMNLFKSCFKRVFPNVQIFDCIDGVVRRMRKQYRKYNKDDSACVILDKDGNKITDKYSIFVE